MSIRQDYIKKQIDQMTKVLAKVLSDVLGLKNDLRLSEAEELVNTVFEKELGFHFDTILQLHNEALLHYLRTEKGYSTETIEEIANLIFEMGETKNNKEEQTDYLKKAIFLFEHINEERNTFSFDFMVKINRMKELMK